MRMVPFLGKALLPFFIKTAADHFLHILQNDGSVVLV